MPSAGYGPGDDEDRTVLARIMEQMIGDEYEGMLPDLLAVYVAARLAGATPVEAAQAGFIEWDL